MIPKAKKIWTKLKRVSKKELQKEARKNHYQLLLPHLPKMIRPNLLPKKGEVDHPRIKKINKLKKKNPQQRIQAESPNQLNKK